jgi:hypothetical protein
LKSTPTIATVKIRMLKASLRCFVLGLLGLLPIIGPPFAFAALWTSGRARADERYLWNAARPYRLCGLAAAALGAVVWSGVDMILIYHSINSYISN